jgi:adenylate kinase
LTTKNQVSQVFLILLGAPGTGKGTQAHVLAEKQGWLHVSTGDMLREAVTNKTVLGEAAKKYMDQGALVPDDLVIDMLVERIGRPDAQQGVIFDGYPRNLAQAKALDRALEKAARSIDVAINIAVPDEELVKRLSGRWMCRNCGAIYSESAGLPDKCRRCGGALYQRDDDKPETVKSRLAQQKPPADMVDHYRQAGKLVDVNGLQTIERVTEDIGAIIQEVTEGSKA